MKVTLRLLKKKKNKTKNPKHLYIYKPFLSEGRGAFPHPFDADKNQVSAVLLSLLPAEEKLGRRKRIPGGVVRAVLAGYEQGQR